MNTCLCSIFVLTEKSKRWILKLFMITIHDMEKNRESAQRRKKPQLSMNIIVNHLVLLIR